MPLPSVHIVIVNWNAGEQLRACLHSLATASRTAYTLTTITVVDNASHDRSTTGLDDLGLPLQIIHNPDNRGFGTACNQGAEHSQSDYLLFLNPDVRVEKDTLDQLLACAARAKNQKTGIFGPQLVGHDGQIQRLCARFPTPARLLPQLLGLDRSFPRCFPGHFMHEWDHRHTRLVEQVPGGFLLIRRSLFHQLGGFDTRFFMYFEDVDLAYRARQAGWYTLFCATSRAIHAKGGTTGQIRALRLFYFLRSRVLYIHKHFGKCAGTATLLATLLIEPLPRLAASLLRRSGHDTRHTLRAYLMLWRTAGALVGTRRNS